MAENEEKLIDKFYEAIDDRMTLVMQIEQAGLTMKNAFILDNVSIVNKIIELTSGNMIINLEKPKDIEYVTDEDEDTEVTLYYTNTTMYLNFV